MKNMRALCAMAAASLAIVALTQVPRAQVGSRSFERTVPLEDPADNSASVSVGDLNGDAWPDIVFGNGHHTPLHNRVWISDGKGHFTAGNLGDTPDRTFSASLADIDEDGDLDVVVSNDMPDRKLIYKNDGKAKFTLAGSWGEPSWPTRHVTVADLNSDGYPDIIAANAGASLPLPIPYPSFMCLNDRTGSFPSCRPLPSESAVRILAADFDGNDTIDLFVPHRDGGRNFILWNNGTGFVGPTSFRLRTAIGSEQSVIRVSAVGDFNGDGRPDLVVCDDESKTISVFLNAGGRMFHEPFSLTSQRPVAFAVAVADLNHDGTPDIVVGCSQTPGSVYFNLGDGRRFTEVRWNDGKGLVDEIAFGDMDKDGWLDIIAARSGAPNGIWFNSSPVRPAE